MNEDKMHNRVQKWVDRVQPNLDKAIEKLQDGFGDTLNDKTTSKKIVAIVKNVQAALSSDNPDTQLHSLVNAHHQLKELQEGRGAMSAETKTLITLASETFGQAKDDFKAKKGVDGMSNLSKAATLEFSAFIATILDKCVMIIDKCMSLMDNKQQSQETAQKPAGRGR